MEDFGIYSKTTLALFFDVVNQQTAKLQGGRGYVKFINSYQHSNGTKRYRVTTVARK